MKRWKKRAHRRQQKPRPICHHFLGLGGHRLKSAGDMGGDNAGQVSRGQPMTDTYTTWVAANVPDAYGTCKEVTQSMVEAFPELRRVRGHYYCGIWGERQHWWCVSPAGEIVDPTAAQFPSKGLGEYVEWVEGTEEPTGMCPNCGELCYGTGTCCSKACEQEYARYVLNPW